MPEAVPHIVASLVCKWLALVANVAVTWTLAGVVGVGLEAVAPGVPEASGVLAASVTATVASAPAASAPATMGKAAPALAVALLVRVVAIYLAQREGDRAAFLAVRRVRRLVYGKLTELGPSHAETVPTAEAVQTGVEGASQLQVCFGGYLPQLFYALLAPVTLFALLVGQAGLAAAVLMVCVPLIPASIMAVMRNAKKIGAEYWGSYVDPGGMFLEAVQGLTTLKVYRADAAWHERTNAEAERFRKATMKRWSCSCAPSSSWTSRSTWARPSASPSRCGSLRAAPSASGPRFSWCFSRGSSSCPCGGWGRSSTRP